MVEEKLYGRIKYIDQSKLAAPVLLVVIDTEEEFNWSEPHCRSETSVSAMRHIHMVQEIFAARSVIPCYVMDYPVASQAEGMKPLKEYYQSGQCTIGAHLHPWVNPPQEEEVSAYNSFPGNLPRELEYQKLSLLIDQIEMAFDSRPTVYKAGRYGIGPNTAETLESLGLNIDLSPTPGFNYANEDGPDYSYYTNNPFTFGSNSTQLCIPCTGGYVGYLGGMSRPVYEVVSRPALTKLKLPGILSRLGAVERLRLSPEGYELEEMMALSDHLINKGCKVLTLSFHSPSVTPGHTPYVRTKGELDVFLGKVEDYIDYFLTEYSGQARSPEELHALWCL